MIRNDRKSERYFVQIILVFIITTLITGCANRIQEDHIAGKTYVYTYEKEGFTWDFTIEINEDGTFYYYEWTGSSYIGNGQWELNGDTLILQDTSTPKEGQIVNYFKVEGHDLVFQSENSTNFLYIEVADGERFSESLPKS